MKKYVSGKINGLTEAEYTDHFARGCALVMTMGDTPLSPLTVQACEPEDCNGDWKKDDGSYLHSWTCYLKYDIIAMLECDAIVMLPNWDTSRGAKFEMYVAEQCGLTVEYISSDYRRIGERVQSER